MSKLFAMENDDTGLVDAQLEVMPEEGEAADVQVDVQEEAGGVAEQEAAIDEGMGAADQLEQVEEVVADAAEGEGLEPVAAEAIKIAVEAICARVGANPKAVYSLYATENFQSASSRKANTKIALEGVGEFLKDMWRKIKAALQSLWAKVKAFWAKHVSSLGRIKKALESMKSKVGSSSGKLKDKAYIEEAPSGLKDAFGFSKDVSVDSIKAVIASHRNFTKGADDIAKHIQAMNNVADHLPDTSNKDFSNILSAILKDTNKTVSLGSKDAPLVGGGYITYKLESDKAEGEFTVEVERENVERESKIGVSLSDKAGVQSVLQDTITIINDTIRRKEKIEKDNEATNKLFVAMEKRINEIATNGTPEAVKAMRKIMKIAYKANAKSPMIQTEEIGLNVKLGKAVLGYAALCMKNYK